MEGVNTIAKDKVVAFRYIMRNRQGSVLEDTTSGVPTRYLHGTAAISPILQSQLEGMQSGQTGTIELLQSQGHASGDLFFEIFIDRVRPADEKEILLGYPLSVDEVCDENCECYNE